MELCNIEIESFEHYKLIVKEKVSNELFRQELIDAFIDGILQAKLLSWGTLESKHYADVLSGINYEGLTDTELFCKIVKFIGITIEESDLAKYFILEQLEINREKEELVFKLKVTKPALETLSLSIRFFDYKSDVLRDIPITFSLNVAANTEITQTLPIPKMDKEIIRVALYYNNNLLSEQEAFHDKTFALYGVSFKMIAVQGGSFLMGSTYEQMEDARDDERPAHHVYLSRFYIGEVLVTQQLWTNVMDSNPSIYKGGMLPVENVTKEDCLVFIERLNRRLSSQLNGMLFSLPTEAQWEYAARGGQKSGRYKYSGSNTLDEVAWFRQNSGDKTHPVALKKPNELGIYDMSGNVSEWCLDMYTNYTENEETDPLYLSSSVQYNSTRGGDRYDRENCCRVTSRSYRLPDNNSSYTGFRLVLNCEKGK